MLDNGCNDQGCDGFTPSGSTLISGRCACGRTLTIRLDRLNLTPDCDCGRTPVDGLRSGPDWRAIIIQAEPAWHTASEEANVVYFVQCAGAVKIGTTGNLRDRLSSLGEHTFLGAMPGGFGKERETHRRFDHLRVHGEVFEAAPELLEYVRAHSTITELPDPPVRSSPTQPHHVPWWLKKGVHDPGRGEPEQTPW